MRMPESQRRIHDWGSHFTIRAAFILGWFLIQWQSAYAADEPGVTRGDFSVNPGGGARYDIPIIVPPGTAEMQPRLSLSYSSNGSNGLLGLGWSLGELPAISRCPATLAQDGFIDGVDFDNTDRFCLDGQRLMAIDGAYGSDGTEYRTEIDSFTRVISYGSAGNGPQRFRAWTRNGHIIDYGDTSDSRIEASGRSDVLVWAANRIEDRFGNFMTFTYEEDSGNGDYRPLRIDYTANDDEGVTPFNSVRFGFESRPDVVTEYLAGSRMTTTQRLRTIQTWAEDQLVKEYRLSYDQEGEAQRSRLRSVQEFDGSGNTLPSIQFDWQTRSGNTFSTVNYPLGSYSGGRLDGPVGDFNGDGRTDFITYEPYSGIPGRWSHDTSRHIVHLSDGDGTFTQVNYPLGDYIGGCPNGPLGDFNGDGLTDFITYQTYEGQVGRWNHRYDRQIVHLSNGDGTFSKVNYQFDDYVGGCVEGPVGDFNGDGRTDFITYEAYEGIVGRWRHTYHTQKVHLSNGDGTFTKVSYQFDNYVGGCIEGPVGDFNGDGMTDFITYEAYEGIIGRWRHTYDKQKVHLANGDGTFTKVNYQFDNYVGGCIEGPVGDFNGDGMTDFITYEAYEGIIGRWRHTYDKQKVHLSRGDGTFQKVNYQFDDYVGGCIRGPVGDFNGDGLTDFVTYEAHSGIVGRWRDTYGTHKVHFSRGDGTFTKVGYPLGNYPGGCVIGPQGDFNGDGLSDFLTYEPYSGQIGRWSHETSRHLVHLARGPAPGFIHRFTGSLGDFIDVTYTPLTDDDVYTRGQGSLYPDVDIQPSMHVVSRVDTDDGLGGTRGTSYKYSHARLNLQGRGFLGFESVETKDELTSNIVCNSYGQSFPHAFSLSSSRREVQGGILVENQELTYDTSGTLESLGVFAPFVVETQMERHEVDGTSILSSTMSQVADAFGNITTKITELGGLDPDGQPQTYRTTIQNTYENNEIAWILGKATRTEETREDGGSTETRVTAYAYDPSNGALLSKTVEPDRPTMWVTSDYTYDGFGNEISVSVLGPDFPTRTTSALYDGRGQFLVEVTNALDHKETREFDPRFGVVCRHTGPNGLTKTWDYDGFGRKIAETKADGSVTQFQRTWSAAAPNNPTGGVLVLTSVRDHTVDNTAYSDSRGRVLRVESQGFDGTAVLTDTMYDSRGLKAATSLPYRVGDTPYWQTMSYDLLGRVTTTMTPDGGETSVNYSGLTTTTTNALGQVNSRIQDIVGRVARVVDHESNVTNFSYTPFGQLQRVVDPNGNVTLNEYDARGRRTATTSPDMGRWTYAFDALGQTLSQTDAKGQVLSRTYDELGRVISRSEPEGVTTFVFDQSPGGLGKLSSATGVEGDETLLQYDSLGRPSVTTRILDGVSYAFTHAYDAHGRLDSLTYPPTPHRPQGLTLHYNYNDLGYLTQIVDYSTATLFWQADDMNAGGDITQQTFGNGITTEMIHDPMTGRLARVISSSLSAYADRQDDTYTFDPIGNLVERRDDLMSFTETFAYDGLNRLTSATVTNDQGVHGKAYAYNALGNLVSKSDVGAYVYGQRPHAALRAGTRKMAYDVNGNLVRTLQFERGVNRFISWNSANKPKAVWTERAGVLGAPPNVDLQRRAEFRYGADRERISQIFRDATGTRTHTYVGDLFEIVEEEGRTSNHHYVMAGGSVVAIYTSSDDGVEKTRYLHRDHLGSIARVTDESATIVENLSYDPFGKRRLSDGSDASGLADPETPFGFTGHLHVDGLDLIHMRGRVYDPILGRFTSPDPFVQEPLNLQSHNRYSYAINNPASLTDPSGYFFSPVISALAAYFGVDHKARKRAQKELKRAGRRVRATHKRFDRYLIEHRWAQVAGQVITGTLDFLFFQTGAFTGAFDAYLVRIAGGSDKDLALAFGAALGGSALHFFTTKTVPVVRETRFASRDLVKRTVNEIAQNEIGKFSQKKLGLSGQEFNFILQGVSFAGNVVFGSRARVHQGKTYIDGLGTRGLLSLPFDSADIILGYQGILSSSATRAATLHAEKGYPLDGYSLGALEVNGLGFGDVTSLPFGNISGPGVHVTNGTRDLVNGGLLSLPMIEGRFERSGLLDTHVNMRYSTNLGNDRFGTVGWGRGWALLYNRRD